MKKKILKVITIMLLIIALTSINVLFLGYHIVIALAEELETQGNNTNISDVQFDAYFKTDNGNTHYRQANISDNQVYLYINVNVLEKGSVNNAKIKINDSNFKVKESGNSNAYVKNINLDANEIELNPIIYNNNVEIEIPIEFNKTDNINANYFSKETNITLEGTYKEEENEKALEGAIITRLDWTDNAEVNMSQTIEKCVDLGENGILLQQGITTKIENDSLPRELEQFTITVPRIGDILPTSINVVINGMKLDENKIQYDRENAKLNVAKEIVVDSEGNTSWDSGIDEYKIIYTYDQSARDMLSSATLHTEMNSKLFTKENIVKTDEQQIKLEFKGNAVSVEKTATGELYKGYLYANSSNETIFEENNIIEISNSDIVDSIKVSTNNSYFASDNGTTYDANGITFYKETLINKNNFVRLFGENGYINILDANGNLITTVNNLLGTDDNGNIHITYSEPINVIVFETSKPVEEGKLTIQNVRYIQGNTGYSKEQLKGVTKFNTNETVETNLGTDVTEVGINLLDTITEAKLGISNNSLTTLQTNENVQIFSILKSDSAKYDLYKNPYIEIKLPEELERIDFHSINLLYGDGLQIVQQNYSSDTKTIQIQLEGEQADFRKAVEEGIQIVINADLTFRKDVPTKELVINMLYNNENASETQYQTSINVKLNSKYGAYLYNNISGYNDENTVLESIDNETLMAQLDLGGSEKQATIRKSFINNYETPINQIAIVGNLKGNNNSETNLLQKIETNRQDVKIYYSIDENASAEDQSWQENLENIEEAKSYKIELNGELEPSGIVNMGYRLDIPTQLEKNMISYDTTKVTYYYTGQQLTTSSTIQLFTEDTSAVSEITDEGITAKMISTTANGQELTDGEEIFEGQPISYTVEIKNNTGRDLTNIQFIAEHTNVVYYVEKEELATTVDSIETPDILITTEKDENAKNITKELDMLKNGETATFTYLISPKKIDGNEISGKITITADNLEMQEFSTITNTIKDAKIAAEVINHLDEKVIPTEDDIISFKFNVTNYLQEPQNDVILKIYTSGLTCVDDAESIEEILGFELTYDNNVLVIRIPTLEANETRSFNLTFEIGEILNTEVDSNINIYYTAQVDNNDLYYSNTIERKVQRTVAIISGTQSSDVEGKTLKPGDKITYIANIKNDDTLIDADNLELLHEIEGEHAQIENAYLQTQSGEIIEATITNQREATVSYNLKAGEEVKYIAEVSILDEEILNDDYENNITSYMSLAWNLEGTLVLNEITNNIEVNTEGDGQGGNQGDNNDDNDNNGDNDNVNTYSISGTAWSDNNKNGVKDINEGGISSVEVNLMDSQTEEIIGNTTTDTSGYYQFNELAEGSYIVIFNYDSSLYSITQYKKDGVQESENSDVIQREIQGRMVAITDSLVISNQNLSNIDAGFIENEKFDLSLSKTINKVIVQNSGSTKQISYDKASLAKVEIDSKYITNTTVLVEYNIEVKNEGEVQGYVNEIIDYIPSDLKFSSEINKDWYMGTDGNIHNVSLSNDVIQPGETRTLTLTLTKQMTADNTGNSINTAEIARASNNLSLSDEDSTPGNQTSGEDDISTAELVISIRTGLVATSIITIITVLIVGSLIIYVIYKKREKRWKQDEEA